MGQMQAIKVRMPLDVEKIQRLRLKRGLSLAQAAEAAGFKNRQKWWDLENGRRPNPTLSTIEAVARALGCSPRELLKE